MLLLLARFEASPSASFAEEELLRDCLEDFEALRSLGLIREVEQPVGTFRCEVKGTSYIATRDGDAYIAVEADEPQPRVVRLDDTQVRRWIPDIPAIVSVLQRENGLAGPPERISDRLWYVGQTDGNEAVLLGLHREVAGLEIELAALPARFPRSTAAFLVVCPTTQVPPLLQVRLQKDKIRVINLEEQSGWKLPLTSDARLPNASDFVLNSPDYKSVTMRGRSYRLSVRRAKVVRILHRAWLNGQKELPWSAVQGQLRAEPDAFYPNRMQDIFRDLDSWEELVKRTASGFYSLNL